MNQIDVTLQDPEWRTHGADAIALRAATAALDHAMAPAKHGRELSVVLASDAQVRALNRDYRHIDKPTNVLSFASEDDDGRDDSGPRMLGDVILARETLEREALAGGISVSDHLSHLVVHGILHLLGYDHEIEAQAERMETHEAVILSQLGIANPYAQEAVR